MHKRRVVAGVGCRSLENSLPVDLGLASLKVIDAKHRASAVCWASAAGWVCRVWRLAGRGRVDVRR